MVLSCCRHPGGVLCILPPTAHAAHGTGCCRRTPQPPSGTGGAGGGAAGPAERLHAGAGARIDPGRRPRPRRWCVMRALGHAPGRCRRVDPARLARTPGGPGQGDTGAFSHYVLCYKPNFKHYILQKNGVYTPTFMIILVDTINKDLKSSPTPSVADAFHFLGAPQGEL